MNESTHLGESFDEVLAHVDGHRDELLGVGADDLLHDRGEVVVLSLTDDVQQLEGDFADLRLDVNFGNLVLRGNIFFQLATKSCDKKPFNEP